MVRYERLPPPGQGIIAYGATLSELFEHAAYGLFDQWCDLAAVPPRYSRPVMAGGDPVESLLLAWLDELVAMAHAERLAPSYFTVDRLEEGAVQGSAAGTPLDAVTGAIPPRRCVDERAVAVVPIPDGWWARVPLRAAAGRG